MDWVGGFCALATQYYVAGRLAARAGLITVYGNLLHHAVEMYLKSALVGILSVDPMRRPPYSHDLTALWDRFRQHAADPALARYDATIRALQAFESIRYPDAIVSQGMLASIVWRPGESATAEGLAAAVPRYEVAIGDVDALIVEILDRASINPKFYSIGFNDIARDALRYENPRVDRWL